ncbi:MAG TPA: hypothetical protein VNW29_07565 [Candidatus Sulfotelmatobacter sp.]|jgi:hypothetical protein|nr:hypothetical protein [Candidatus Sulfotelmatobacter sp.]
MIISNVLVGKQSDQTVLSADIIFRGKPTQQAYFKVSDTYKSFVSTDASPFLAALLLSCMKTRENIYIDGSISEKLLKNANEIMIFVSKRKIKMYKIKIRSKKVIKDSGKPRHIGSFFTGGVNSFYTYLNHQKKKDKITHFILVHRMDTPHENKTFFIKAKSTVQKVAKEEKIKVVLVETNIGSIIDKTLVWDFINGGVLASIALLLRKNFKKIFIAGAIESDQLFPNGISSKLYNLWSTETLELKNDDVGYDRLTKITKVISKSPLALKYLFVCTQNANGKYNCSHCYQCLITMIYLVCADSLKQVKTFDKKLDLDLVKKMYFDYKLKHSSQGEAAIILLKNQKRELDLQEAIGYSLEKSKKPKLVKRFYQTVTQWDQKYNEQRLHQFVLRINNNNKDTLFKFLFLKKQ